MKWLQVLFEFIKPVHPFHRWLLKRRGLLPGLLLVVLFLVAVLFWNGRQNVLQYWTEAHVYFGVIAYQGIIIFLLLLVTLRRREVTDEGEKYEIPALAFKQFHNVWCAVWAIWGAFYVVLAIGAWPGLTYDQSWWFPPLRDTFNNLSSFSFLLCYIVLVKRTVPANYRVLWSLIICFAALTGVEFVGAHLGYSGTGFAWFSGIFAGLMMALLIGRLAGESIDPPTWTVIGLYFYAGIQSTIVLFKDASVIISMSLLALVLKLLLFVLVEWTLRTGIIGFHLYEARKATDDDYHKDRDVFLRGFIGSSDSSG